MRIVRPLAAIVLPIIVAASCAGGDSARTSVADASARIAMAAASISGQDALIAREIANGSSSYMGFDTGAYPGDDAMRAWRTGDSPYRWAGYYLPSPCHQDE